LPPLHPAPGRGAGIAMPQQFTDQELIALFDAFVTFPAILFCVGLLCHVAIEIWPAKKNLPPKFTQLRSTHPVKHA
jgi:hypothetical protein